MLGDAKPIRPYSSYITIEANTHLYGWPSSEGLFLPSVSRDLNLWSVILAICSCRPVCRSPQTVILSEATDSLIVSCEVEGPRGGRINLQRHPLSANNLALAVACPLVCHPATRSTLSGIVILERSEGSASAFARSFRSTNKTRHLDRSNRASPSIAEWRDPRICSCRCLFLPSSRKTGSPLPL